MNTPEEKKNKLENINQALEALYSIVSVANSCFDRDTVFDRILKQVLELIEVNIGGIYLFDEKTGVYVLKKYVGVSEEFTRNHRVINREFVSFLPVMEKRQVICVDNVDELPDSPRKKSVVKERIVSYASIPLESKGRLLGILNLGNHTPHHYTSEEVKIFKLIGKHVGIAVDNFLLIDELKKSEAKYKDLFENAIVPMYIFDTQGNILKINNVGLQFIGVREEEIVGTNISQWLTPESLIIVQKRLIKRLSGEDVNQTVTLELICKNGEHRWADVTARVLNKGDNITEIHGIAKDITDNIRLKQKLKKSNKQKKLLCYLIEGTRGGKTRALILRHLTEKSYNAHQLAKALNMDYKTIRHHLKVLEKKGMITRGQDEYSGLYFIAKNIESDLGDMDI